MKQVLSLIVSVVFSFTIYSQSNTINYKAFIKDDLGNVVANQTITMQISVLEDVTSIYQETHTPTTNANGLVILNIGTGTTSDIFSDINWNTYNHSLNVQVDIGAGLVDLGTTAFKTVPYAKFAENSISEINNLKDAKAEGRSVYLGSGSGNNDDGDENKNTAVGYNALRDNSGGEQNVAIGEAAMFNNTLGFRNVAVGQSSMRENINGYYNTVIGEEALYYNQIGHSNVAIGREAGEDIVGNRNIVIGHQAGKNETGSDKLYIENSNSSSPLIYGEFNNDLLRINGTLDINNAYQLPTTDGADSQFLQTDGSGTITWQTPEQPSGLEYIDETDDGINNGGWRIKDRDSANYGGLGEDAVDLSISNLESGFYGATSEKSVALGTHTTSSGYASTAMGHFTTATSLQSTAMGDYTVSSGYASTAMGRNTEALAHFSTSMGKNTKAEALSNTVIGQYNIGGGDPDDWVETDPIFEVGNGDNDANKDNAITVLKNGKVGIGEHQPDAFLEIKASNSTSQPHINLIHEGTTGARINFSNTDTTNGNRWVLYGDTNDVDANSVFNIFHPNIGNIVRIHGDGEVGIGTAPSYKLDVRGSADGDYAAQVYNTSTNANADGLKIRIGRTTAPTSSNSFVAFFDGNNTSRGRIQGNGTGITYGTTSDRRLKTNIKDVTNALALIDEIEPRIYEYKTNLGKKEYGFIAQELQPLYAQAVTGSPDSDVEKDPMMVDYSRLTPLLTAGIKELNDKVKFLEIENAALKQKLNKLEQLEARLSALETASSSSQIILTDKK